MNGGAVIFLLLMFVFLYVLLIRPQRQQQRRHAQMLDQLKVGDEVITAGGIYGDVTGIEPDRVALEIAEDVEIEVAKRAIASIVPPEDADDGVADELDEAEPGETEPVLEERFEADAPTEKPVPEEDAARR